MPGKITAWASKNTYVGVDTMRGSPNAAQSEATPTYTKWVFDWPTNAGNGIISSIGWMKLVAASPRSPNLTFTSNSSIVQTKTVSIPYVLTIAKASPTVWFGASGSGSTIFVLDANFQQTSAFSIVAQFSTYAPAGIAWDSINSKLWVLGKNSGSTSRIASYSQAGSLIDGPFTVTNRNYYGLTFDGTDLFTLGDSTTNTTGNTVPLYKISISGAELASYSVPLIDYLPAGNAYYERARSIAYDTERNQLIVGSNVFYNSSSTADPASLISNYGVSGRFMYFDTNGNSKGVDATSVPWPNNQHSVTNSTRASIYSYATQNYYTIGPDFEYNGTGEIVMPQAITSGNVNNVYINMVRIDGMGSRTLLASPVTKNNTQTMKITYQMNYT